MIWTLATLATIALLTWAFGRWLRRSLGRGLRLSGGGWRWVMYGRRNRKGGESRHSVYVALPIASPLHFEVRAETWLSRLGSRFGLSADAETGDAAFDDTVRLTCDEPQLARWLKCTPAVAAAIRALVTDLPFGWQVELLACRGGIIGIELAGDLDTQTPPEDIADAAYRELHLLIADLATAPAIASRDSERNFRRATGLQAFALALVVAPLLHGTRLWNWGVLATVKTTAGVTLAMAILVGLLIATAWALSGSVRRNGMLAWMLVIGGAGAFLTGMLLVRDVDIARIHGEPLPLPALSGGT